MNNLKSLFWAAAICFVAQAVHAKDLTQDSLQKASEILNLASEPFSLLLEKEASEAGKMYCHPCGFCTGRGGSAMGPTGPTGPMGPPAVGSTGPTGATGPAGSGTFIAYASSEPFGLSYAGNPLELEGATLGFGSYFNPTVVNGQIDLNDEHVDYAFSMPRDGVITSLSADFSASEDLTLDASIATVTAQLYSSTTSDNIFIPVPGASITLAPTLSGNVPMGTTITGRITGLNISVDAETRLLLVYTMTANPPPLVDPLVVTGIGSAGLRIN